MVILPLGLVSKPKTVPLATILITVVTVFVAIYNFPTGEMTRNFFWNGPSRKAFATKTKKHLVSRCNLLEKTFCSNIKEIPSRFFVKIDILDKTEKRVKNKTSKETLEFINTEMSEESLKLNNPELLKLKKKMKAEATAYLKKHNLLSHDSISWNSSFYTLFFHGGWLHLLGNMLILIFLAFPVEERMGSVFFAITYFISGMFGSTLHVLLSQDTLYLVGASSSVSGVAGALTYFFWKNHARVHVSFFFTFSRVVTIPVFIYSPLFLVASDVVGTMDPLTNVAHTAHLGGFAMGLLLAMVYNLVLPLPAYFTYPFEFEFYDRCKKGYSQYDRIIVLTKWLYYAPGNLYAFKGLVQESARSDLNPAVQKELSHFKKNFFEDVHFVNRKKLKFLQLLPVDWLADIAVGDDPGRLKKWAEQLEDERDFACAFKACFLVLNEVGWSNTEWSNQLIKNYKKASINEEFMKSAAKLIERHAPFSSLIRKRTQHVQSA